MRVLYIFDEDDKYGAAKAGMEMVKEVKKNNIIPIVVTSNSNGINFQCDKLDIENYSTGHHKFTYCLTSSKLNNIVKFLPRFFRYKISLYLALYKIGKKIDLSTIDIIHSNNSGIDLGVELSRKYNIPNIIHIREYGVGDNGYRVHSYRKNYIKYFNRYVNKFILISNAVSEFWIKKGIDKSKIEKIYDGVDTKNIKIAQNNNKKIRFIILGSISEGKGQIELLKALNLLNSKAKSQIEIDIVGSGTKEDELLLISKIKKYNLEKIVFFKGYDGKIYEKLNNYDFGINCSKAEGFGRTTIEYLSSGLFVIASSIGANKELICDKKLGTLYEIGNEEDLSKSLLYVINNKRILFKEKEYRVDYARQFSVYNNCNEVIKVYKELINK